MSLEKIYVDGFRNIIEQTIIFNKNITFFIGDNGQGKTNILEAVFFCFTGRSFRESRVDRLCNYEKTNFLIKGEINDGIKKELKINYINKKKELFYNNKKVKLQEFYGKKTIVSFVPEDIKIVSGAISFAREYFDFQISQVNKNYFNLLKNLKKIIQLKNIILKNNNSTKDETLNIYNEKISEISSNIIVIRRDFILNLNILLALNYRKIFKKENEVEIDYKSIVGDLKTIKNRTKEELKKDIELKIKKSAHREKKYKFSIESPRRDKFIFLCDKKNIKYFSSEGEKKSFLFSLKYSELDIFYKHSGVYPLLIVDDFGSTLDKKNQKKIYNFFVSKKIQVIISSTDIDSNIKTYYKVNNGNYINYVSRETKGD